MEYSLPQPQPPAAHPTRPPPGSEYVDDATTRRTTKGQQLRAQSHDSAAPPLGQQQGAQGEAQEALAALLGCAEQMAAVSPYFRTGKAKARLEMFYR